MMICIKISFIFQSATWQRNRACHGQGKAATLLQIDFEAGSCKVTGRQMISP